MWTTGRFGKLTGIPARTLQEWSKTPRQTTGGKTSGSGILPAKSVAKNGYRLFDEASLRDVLAIKLAKDAGLQDAQIRAITNKEGKNALAIDRYIEQLLHERHALDAKIRIARSIASIERETFACCTVDDEAGRGADELEAIVASELLEAIVSRIVAAMPPHEDDLPRISGTQKDAWMPSIARLEAMCTRGCKPSSDETQAEIEQLHRSLDRLPYELSRADFAAIAHTWISQGYARLAFAIQGGEEFLTFFETATDLYGSRASD